MTIASLAQFSAQLRRLPKTTALRVAAECAPAITALAKKTFAAGQNAFGVPWTPLADGAKATLHDTGTLFRETVYVASGTKLRVKIIDPDYRYVIGKRPIFPSQGGALPTEYVRTLQRVAVAVVREEMGR